MSVNWQEISQRVREMRTSNRMSQKEFSAILGMSRSAYAQFEIGAMNLSLDAIVLLCEHFKLSLETIVLGKETIYSTSNPTTLLEKGTPLAVTVDSYGKERIVLVDIKARASYPQYRLENSYYRPLPSFSLPGEMFQQATYRCFELEGDSMEKTLFAGDWVVAKFVDLSLSNYKDNYVYILITNEDVLIKRVKIISDEIIELRSDNDFYSPIRVQRSEIKEAWFAVKKISGNFMNHDLSTQQTINLVAAELLSLKSRIEKIENK